VSFEKEDNEKTGATDAPNYPSSSDSPIIGNQNIVRHSMADKNSRGAGGSWGFLQTIGSIISQSLYW